MSKNKKESYFWASYSDLMTSLFFVMLVLFILTVVLLHKKISDQEIELAEFQKIEEIKNSINKINKEYFKYIPEYKKHVLKLSVQYPTGSYEISNIKDAELLLPKIEAAGNEIKKTIENLRDEENIMYLVIIEGQASKDGYNYNNLYNNDVLSFLRALKLKEFWESKNIFLDQLDNCELIIAGSGEKGIPRDQPDIKPNNQRFLIHIIPKTGTIK
jgi:hypothetical protein